MRALITKNIIRVFIGTHLSHLCISHDGPSSRNTDQGGLELVKGMLELVQEINFREGCNLSE